MRCEQAEASETAMKVGQKKNQSDENSVKVIPFIGATGGLKECTSQEAGIVSVLATVANSQSLAGHKHEPFKGMPPPRAHMAAAQMVVYLPPGCRYDYQVEPWTTKIYLPARDIIMVCSNSMAGSFHYSAHHGNF
jgi:hypothetical protein